MEEFNQLMLFGFNLGFWLTSFGCLAAFAAKKIFYMVVHIIKPTN